MAEFTELEIPDEEYKVILALEREIHQPIPLVDSIIRIIRSKKNTPIIRHQIGYVAKDGHITELGLCPRAEKSLLHIRFQLHSLPEDILKLKHLEFLDLSSNGLSTVMNNLPYVDDSEQNIGLNLLPNWFGNLKSLKTLDLSWNKLTSLPDSFSNLSNLKKLYLNHNSLRNIPESFGNLKSITELSLARNELTNLPEKFGDLQSLEILDLQKNKLEKLPDSIGNLLNLRRLNLSDNKLMELPQTIGNLISLRELYLEDNNLTTLPENISFLASLVILKVNNNKLVKLPENFGDIIVLQELNLSNNKLNELPSSFAKLNFLKKLNLKNNDWNDDFKKIIDLPIQELAERMRIRAGLYVYIINEREDEDKYKIPLLAANLQKRKEIFEANYTDWKLLKLNPVSRDESIKKSHYVIFFCTKNSIRSRECRHMLELANSYNKTVIPVKTNEIPWENLAVLGFNKLSGVEFSPDNEKFYNSLLDLLIKPKLSNIKSLNMPIIPPKRSKSIDFHFDIHLFRLKKEFANIVESKLFRMFVNDKYPRGLTDVIGLFEDVPKKNAEIISDLLKQFSDY